jgi:ABC-2 type transport system ATP-binding protein
VSSVVRAVGLTRRFGSFVAVDHVSFEVASGSIWGFLGPNGAGKSTTIRMLCGILEPNEGTAEVLGYDVRREPDRIKAQIGYMSQRSSLWGDLTVRENLEFYAGLYGIAPARARQRMEPWLERTRLAAVADQSVATLSGGFRQRLALVCSVLHGPQVLFLDEPTAGVDLLSRREFWQLMIELAAAGTTLMVTTHYLDEVSACDHLAFIDRGRIVASGSPEAIRRVAIRGLVLEVTHVEPMAALRVVESQAGVLDAALLGNAVHARVETPQGAEALTRALRVAGYEGSVVREVLPSLEDVFVALAGEPDLL